MKNLFFAITFLLAVSCRNKETKEINNSEDLIEADNLGTKFYQLLMQKDSIEIFKVCENDSIRKELKQILKIKDSLLGKIVIAKIKKVQTERVTLNDSIFKSYNILLNVKSTKGLSTETLSFQRDNNKLILSTFHYKIDSFKNITDDGSDM